MPTTEQALHRAQAIRDAISQDTARTTLPLLAAFFKTLLLPLLMFMVVAAGSGYVRVYLDAEFQDESLNTLTAISTSLLTLALAWWALRRAEGRFGGVAAFRRMMAVLGGVRALELAIEAAQAGSPDPAELDATARQSWQTYEQFVAHLRLSPPAAPL
jgi:hypothetical protein